MKKNVKEKIKIELSFFYLLLQIHFKIRKIIEGLKEMVLKVSMGRE